MTTQNGRAATFAALLGIAPRKPKPANAARASTPKPKAAAAPKATPKIRASDFSHLLAAPVGSGPRSQPRSPSPAQQATEIYRRVTGRSGEKAQAPNPGSAAEHAVALYRRLLPR